MGRLLSLLLLLPLLSAGTTSQVFITRQALCYGHCMLHVTDVHNPTGGCHY